MSRKLIQLHDGETRRSSDGRARRDFTIRAAVGRGEYGVSPAPGTRAALHKRVLIIDDNNDAANSMAVLLRLDGHEVDTAYSAEDGIGKVQAGAPEVVLLDIGLPLMDGYEVARRLIASGFKGRLIAISGYGEVKDKQHAAAAGFYAHLSKPVDYATL